VGNKKSARKDWIGSAIFIEIEEFSACVENGNTKTVAIGYGENYVESAGLASGKAFAQIPEMTK
jgi:hypothetical protein